MAVATPLGAFTSNSGLSVFNGGTATAGIKQAVPASGDSVIVAVNACLAAGGYVLAEFTGGVTGSAVIPPSASHPLTTPGTYSVQWDDTVLIGDPDIDAAQVDTNAGAVDYVSTFTHLVPGEAKTQEEIDAALACFETLFGCPLDSLTTVDKDDLIDAVSTWLADNPGGPTPQTFNGQIVGTRPGTTYAPANFGTPVPELEGIVNPACGPEFVTLFVDPNLPENTPAGQTFDFSYQVLDASAGMGAVYAVEKGTGTQIPGTGYAPGAGGPGNTVPLPIDHTITFGPIPAGVDPSDICIMFYAFGASGGAPWGCDEINPATETLVTVTPSPCAAAAACFEAIFGCSVDDMATDNIRSDQEIKDIAQACIDAQPANAVPLPATTVPVPDNELDTAIRTGQVGTSLLYARADHNHAIVRQSYPADPLPLVGGTVATTQVSTIRRWSDEESVYFGFRLDTNQPAGTNWGWIQVLSVPGYQVPIIHAIETYRTTSTAVQEDGPQGAGGPGAGPRGPYMGQEFSHWSFSQRLYSGYLRRDNALRTYVSFVAEYKRL